MKKNLQISPVTFESGPTNWLLGRCSRQLRKSCAVQTWRIREQNVCSFLNITSHRKRLLLFVKHLAMRILTRKYRIRQQYTDW
jgi:hypothetical protein